MLLAADLRKKYFDFFKSKNHEIIPSSPVVPENDPTVLFTTAGMHPLVPYLLGQIHPSGKRLVSVQKCVRTDDIEEVGDTFHHTFFEMLGNWSLGDYFKKDSISWSFEFLTQHLGINPERIHITCFAGDENAPKDVESAGIWEDLGIPSEKIYFFGKKDNWWGPVGNTGPCGPDTEIFIDTTLKKCGPKCQPGCSCGRFCEIWNNVFMEYNKTADNQYIKLSQPNVDTGMGVERTLSIVNGFTDDYLTELWQPGIKILESITQQKYSNNAHVFRIILDHIRAAVFILADGVVPSNKEAGYVLRRLIRRTVIKLKKLDIDITTTTKEIANIFIDIMSPQYPELLNNRDLIIFHLNQEIERFGLTLEKGLKEFNKLSNIDGTAAFYLFQTYGFPLELTQELTRERGLTQIDTQDFEQQFQKHQTLSRTASAGMFKGGLQEHSEITTKYHTATHLLHKALREVLGNTVSQKGSNITSERLRFDFAYPEKLTSEQLSNTEDCINLKITQDLKVFKQEMPKSQALADGAMAFFPEKYPEITTVYTIGPLDDWYSKELCGGPHVSSTGQIGRIKIYKEESVSAGIRRIYAKLVT